MKLAAYLLALTAVCLVCLVCLIWLLLILQTSTQEFTPCLNASNSTSEPSCK